MNPAGAPSGPVQVGPHLYQVAILDATKGYPVYCKLVAQLGKVLAEGGKLPSGSSKGELATTLLGHAIQGLTPELVTELVQVFGRSSTVQINGGWHPVHEVFAVHFAGKYGHMMGWLFECVKANFSDFLPPNLPAVPGVDLGAMFQSTSPKTSTGS